MRIAYLDCFAGIAGDMLLAALLEAGVPLAVLEEATNALGLDAALRVERVDRSGISCTKVHVLERGQLAEAAAAPAGMLEQTARPEEPWTQHPRTQHLHGPGSPHTHSIASPEDEMDKAEGPVHGHGRSLSTIQSLIQHAALAPPVKALSLQAFALLGQAEAKIHNVPVEEIHFHEVGAVDALVDIVASCAGIHYLNVEAWSCSALNVGSGSVRCAHGLFPVPAPATAELLRGMPTYAAHVRKELVTPTGAALLRALNPKFGEQPAMRVEQIGYGAGTRNPEGFPNVLRLSVGELVESNAPLQDPRAAIDPAQDLQTVTVLETALDDASPQVLAYVAEQTLAQGALDVMLTPVVMKKGRPGTLVTVLCAPSEAQQLQELLLRETPTLGVRRRQEQRVCLARHHTTVATPFGDLRIKLGSQAGELRNAAPEYEDCKAAALRHHVPLKVVQQAALHAYLNTPEPGHTA